mmetsp:Transcript_22420/g.47218  ORF Transcript_22420/g.47218 Transcript_22420/m.47218 type:complete len:80 (-) Transcript_22420:77-316(-)
MNVLGRFVCLTCVNHCHKGHDVFSMGYGAGYCDCSIFTPCKCLQRDSFNQEWHGDFDTVSVLPTPLDVFEAPFDPSTIV